MKDKKENIIEIEPLIKTRTIIQQKSKVVDVNKKEYNRNKEKNEWKKEIKGDY
jgi:hypothetical protein